LACRLFHLTTSTVKKIRICFLVGERVNKTTSLISLVTVKGLNAERIRRAIVVQGKRVGQATLRRAESTKHSRGGPARAEREEAAPREEDPARPGPARSLLSNGC